MREWTPEDEAAWETKKAEERKQRESDDIKMKAFLDELQALCLKHGANVGGHEEGFWCRLGASVLEDLDAGDGELKYSL
jgi:hypothetical protein